MGNKLIKIELDPAKLLIAVDAGKQILVDPKAEHAIISFYELKAKVDEFEKLLKAEIEKQGLAISPNFTSVTSDRLKINYSAAGAKYKVDHSKIKKHHSRFFKKKISWSLDSKAADEYRAKNGKMPVGVTPNERKKSISIKVVK